MTTVRQAYIQAEAQTIREAIAYLYDRAEQYELLNAGVTSPMVETVGQRDDALAALDRLEELAA